jgi:hypothetical protein
LAAYSEQESNSKNTIVCPESTIESANKRSSIGTSQNGRSFKNAGCESTIESSLRRDFIRRAALITAAAGVVGAVAAQPLAAKILPKSEAADGCTLKIGQNNFGNVNGCTTMLTACVKRPTNGAFGGGAFLVENNNACAEAAIVGRSGLCNTGTGSGVIGCTLSLNGVGVLARNLKGGTAFVGCSCSPFISKFRNFGFGSDRTALIQFENGDCIPVSWYAGVAGIGNGLGLANGTFFIENFAGSEVVIGSNNNVGIGTNTPNAKISLGEFVGDSFFAYDGPGNKYGLGIRVNELRVFNGIGTAPHTSFGNYDGTTFTEFMRLTNQGNLGVGNSTPGYRLHVTAPNQLGMHVEGPSSGVGAGLTLQTTGASPQGWEILDTGTTAAQGANKLNIRNLNTGKDLLTISGSNVGIGTTSPATQLQVNGTASAASLGLGVTLPKTTLQVNGSVAARVVSESGTSTVKSYKMLASDFAVLANASVLPSGVTTFTVTLPAATTASGMIVFIKRVDGTATHTVTVSANTGDTIEGKSSKVLSKQFDSLQLISNGANEWFVLGNSIGDAFTS